MYFLHTNKLNASVILKVPPRNVFIIPNCEEILQ